MAWRLAIVTEDGTEKLEMQPEALKEFIIRCIQLPEHTPDVEETRKRIIQAVNGGFALAEKHLKQETVRLP